MTTQVVIVGAGISGLVAARELVKQGVDVCVLEARNRLGGRALSVDIGGGHLDLGPAWIWPRAQPQIRRLVQALGQATLAQYETGDFLFETANGVQRGQYPHRYADALRLQQGVQGLAKQLAHELPDGTIRLASEVTGVEFNAGVQVHIANEEPLHSQFIICSAPGPLVAKFDFDPALSNELIRALTRWPTWMAAHAKVLLIYDRPFWRERGLSGSCVSQIGPLFEIADQSDDQQGLFALFGFVGWTAEQRAVNVGDLQSAVEQQMIRLFGADVSTFTAFYYQDWAAEVFTAAAADREAPAHHPAYGDPLLEQSWFDGRLIFAGAETSALNGGLIEGAVESGLRAAKQVLAHGDNADDRAELKFTDSDRRT